MKIIVSLLACLAWFAYANEFEIPLKNFIDSEVKMMIKDPEIIDAIKQQNQKNMDLSQAQIEQLDKDWRSQVGQANSPLIDRVLNSATSAKLKATQENSEGVITEIFIMDNKGLNVAQSAITSDYWQGDEEKWLATYQQGPGAFVIGDIEEDESTQMFQSQISHSIIDPANGEVIGAITIGVNVEAI
ncbi:PDC sensor domain-containing protein [Agarivorans sp. QJM3NY_33]|uniref:PDC sensor domain-containing protein n=1 Tax=Agarivorans sp. QJM3NY_33 TaxID=3421432 RepID=UPI003D7D9407